VKEERTTPGRTVGKPLKWGPRTTGSRKLVTREEIGPFDSRELVEALEEGAVMGGCNARKRGASFEGTIENANLKKRRSE